MRYRLAYAFLLAAQFFFTTIHDVKAGVVAIHDSELTRALEVMPATNAGTPVGASFTGFEWWPTNWHYFVMPQSLKEALASDGTAFEVVSDADISAGRLFTNGQPRYPIVISLASEAIADSEIGQFTNYVAAGGTLLVGSSAFTRQTNGASRGDFAIANQMGLHMTISNVLNWAANVTFMKTVAHELTAHIPAGTINWHMPSAAEETSWGVSPVHNLPQTSLAWQVQAADATVIAQGDGRPYLAVKSYGKGMFIYHAGMQPLIAHGGYGTGMYAYGIFRNAIQRAFAAARAPLARVSPWRYPYDAALNVRHDFEDYQNMINTIESSARYEFTNGVKGDYYFCTGTLREEMTNSPVTIARLRSAVTNYGATIGPHNGGLRNPNNTNLVVADYDYWHWGPDEALSVTPVGYASGKAYASASLSNAFLNVEGWLSGITNGLRIWVAPYFNATREASYDLQEQLGVKIAGEQKLSPFPHWTISTATSGKKYPFLSLPVSDWFVGANIGQSIETGHSTASVHALIDYYYNLGALINLYSHSGSDGTGTSGALVQDYITYSKTKPRLWAANAADVYAWWNLRKTTQIVPVSATSSNQTTVTLSISGATDPQTAVEVIIPQPSFSDLQVFTNGVAASGTSYRSSGQLVRLSVGNTVTNAQVKYLLSPIAQDDQFAAISGVTLNVPAAGVLANDTAGLGTNLTATLVSGTTNGTLSLSASGGFTYTPATNFDGFDAFTYRVNDGIADGNIATVTIHVVPTASILFSDDFSRTNDPGTLSPWVVRSGSWTVTSGMLEGGTNAFQNYAFAYLTNNWTNFTFEARVQFPTGAFGGGLGGRLNPLTGVHYAAWIFPENSPGGDRQLKLIKFQNWSSWGYNGVSFAAMQQITLPSVGTNWHTFKVAFEGNQITVFYDGNQMLNVMDTEAQPLTSGGVSVDMWTETSPYVMNVDDVSVAAPVGDQAITFGALPNRTFGDAPFGLSATASSGLPVSLNILSGPAVLSGTNITIIGAGTVVVRASQAGDASYEPAPAVDRTFIVNPATLTVRADDKAKVYGAVVPALTATYSGFVNGDSATVILGTPSITTTANPGSGVGTYFITAGLGTLSATNYVFNFVSGQLTVTKAGLTVTANDATRNFGDPDPPFSANYTGFVNGDNPTLLSGTPAFSTTAVTTSPEGNYPINVTIGTLSAANYNFSFVSGILTIFRQHVLFSDNFTRTNDPGTLAPWIAQSNNWTITSGMLKGGTNPTLTYGFVYVTNVWTNYSVQARVQFPAGAFGGGVGGRLDSASGTHYAAWVYPEGSLGGSSVLKLIKFQDWSHFGYTNTGFASIREAALPGVGTNWHTVKLTFNTNQISVYYDTNLLFTATDAESQPLTNGGISLDMWTDSNPYVMNVDDVLVTEPPVNQTITFGALANKTYGNAPFTVSATASSGLPVSFSVLSGPATLSGNSVTITGTGLVTIRASQVGSTSFNAAPDVDRSFTVNPAALTVTADNKSRVYGAANPALSGSVTGLQNGDNISANYSTLADPNSFVGTYSIVPTLNDPDSKLTNYSVVTNNGVLTVTAATLTVAIDNKSRTYGASSPALTGNLGGIQNSDNISASYTTVANTASPVGSYPVLPVFSDPGAKLGNYIVFTNGGSLTVTPATLTVTADNKSRTYGAANPPFTASFSGFVNGETSSVLSGSPSLTTTALGTSSVGTYTITAAQGSLTAANYTFAFVDGALGVTPATLTGTADNKGRLYGETNPVFTVTYTGFVSGENAGIVTGTLLSSTTAETNSPAGNYPITVSGQSAPNYTINYVAGTLSVNPAPVLIKADDKNRVYSQTNPVFTATITGLVNGEASDVLQGTLAFSTTAETNSPVGTYPIGVSGLSSTNYSITYSNGTLTVTPFALSVTADNKSRGYGAANPALTGTVTGVQNGDDISASYSTVADVSSPIGSYAIVPALNDPGNKLTNYSVTINNGTLAVSTATLTVTADNQTRVYGSANPTFTGTVTGIQNSDGITATYSTIAEPASPVGTYGIAPALNDPNSKLSNYSVTTNNGTLTVTAAPLSVTANNQTRTYGSANPTLAGTVTGIQNSDHITASYSTLATLLSPVGSYDITPSLNDPDGKLVNYTVTTNNGALTITAATLTGTADNKSRLYGETNPVFTVTYSGFVNGENAGIVTGTLLSSTTADTNSSVGDYPITVSGQNVPNYIISFVTGTLSITPAPVLVKADDKGRAYGQTNPVFTATIIGLINGKADSVLEGTLAFSTAADTNAPIGTYPITVGGLSSTNYSITFSNGTLTVSPFALSVTADNKSRGYGSANPALTGTLSGVQNGDNITASYSTAADATSPIGTYSIVPALNDPNSKLTNYSVTINDGTLTVSPAALTVTADSYTRTYGATNPAFTGTLTGIQNADNITASYSTLATVLSPVNSYAIVPSLNDPNGKLVNYVVTTNNGTLGVTPANLSGTADNKSRLYGETNPVFTVTYSGFVNSENISIVTGTLLSSTTAETNSPVGNYPITISGQSAPNYTVNYVAGTLSVTPAAVLVKAEDKSRAYGNTNPVFTATITGLVNGEASSVLQGSMVFNMTAETNSPVGTYPIEVSGLSSTNYSITYSNGTLTVTPFALSVTADNKSRGYGAANPALTGTLTGVQNGDNITASYSTVADATSSIGTYSIVPALNDPNSKLTNYSVTIGNGTLTVSTAALTVTADNQTRVYGSANPTLIGTVTGVQNSDGITATYSTIADVSSAVGTYSIVPALNDPHSRLTNYSVTINNGTLSVTAAPLTVTADSQSRTYGATNPTLTGILTGIQNADNISATYSTHAAVLSPVNSYSITPSLNDPDGKLVNYTVTTNNGTLSVTPASLTGTAANKSRLYGESNPVFTVTYSGFVNGENASIVTGTLITSTTAETNSPVGNYPITVLGQSAPNYTVNYVAGTLSVTPAPVLVKAEDKSRAYGQANPIFTATITGLVNGEANNVLEGTLAFSTTANTNSPIGSYPINVSGLTSTNYSITFSNGTLTVSQFALTVTADNKSRAYGSANPTLTGTLTGVQNGDNITASYSTLADASSAIGTYNIVPALNDPNSKLTNYTVTINNGTLTVSRAALTVTADNQSRVYGSANPTLTGIVTGVQNSDGITATYSTTANPSSPVGTYGIVPALNDPNSKLTNYSVTTNNGTLTITAAGSALALVSSINPSAENSNVTFTATVSPVSPAAPTPTGNVQFFANGVALGAPASLVNGVANITTSLAAGSNTIDAVYLGDGNFLSSTNTLVQIVTVNLAQPITLGIKGNGNGTVTVRFQGTPGGQYTVQATTSLVQPSAWSNVSTNIAGSDGIWTYTDSTTQPHRFYRAAK